jgi:hypothetical protein
VLQPGSIEDSAMMQSMDPIYLPLVQSIVGAFLGALGAFAVAAYSVNISNKHSARRERDQALAVALREHNKEMRLKLEQLVQHVEDAYRMADRGTNRVLEEMHLIDGPHTLTDEDKRLIDETQNLVERARLLAELYFPHLDPHIERYGTHLLQVNIFNAAQLGALVDFPERAKSHSEETYLYNLRTTRKPADDARQELIGAARDLPRRQAPSAPTDAPRLT